MATRLRQSPWIALSGGVHALLLLLVWTLMPAEEKASRAVQVTMQDQDQQVVELPEPPEQPEIKREEVDPEVTPIEDVVAQENPTETDVRADADSADAAVDAVLSNQWNTALGSTAAPRAALQPARHWRRVAPAAGPRRRCCAASSGSQPTRTTTAAGTPTAS